MASYHHGDLRRVLLSTAAEAIAESGPAALSLRELARRAGVSHAAPAHHFGDKAGLLTAFATQGFDLLADALRQAGDDLLDTGVAYVASRCGTGRTSTSCSGPSCTGPTTRTGRRTRPLRRRAARGRGPATGREPDADALAAWSIVHGFATLWLAGALPSLGWATTRRPPPVP
ncbi:TetR/AcrR family transcriptional regulator [Micromonospora sp. BRA006-A]|nr:TetR/AcrR family transcriptional regulator [Micromonospora sp. BRA006-A]